MRNAYLPRIIQDPLIPYILEIDSRLRVYRIEDGQARRCDTIYSKERGFLSISFYDYNVIIKKWNSHEHKFVYEIYKKGVWLNEPNNS